MSDDQTGFRFRLGGTPVFWVALVVGWAGIVFGVVSARTHRLANFGSLGRWVLALAVLHDAVLIPGSVLLGWLTLKCVPRVVRPPVRIGLAVTWVLTLMSWPAVRRYGARPDNPTILPTSVGRGLLVVLVVVWLAVAVEIARRILMVRSSPA